MRRSTPDYVLTRDGKDQTALYQMITTLLTRITPSCKDVTALSSQAMDRPLPWYMRLKLQLHYWICAACARYRDQLSLIRRTLRGSEKANLPADPSAPSPDTKARLTDAFRAKRDHRP